MLIKLSLSEELTAECKIHYNKETSAACWVLK